MSSTLRAVLGLVAYCVVALWVNSSRADTAQEPAEKADQPGQTEEPSPWVIGPSHVALAHDLTIDVPEADAFLPAAPAEQLLVKMGNLHNDGILGLVTDKSLEAGWFVVIRYDDSGYVADDEEIDADELLTSMREGVEASNDEREKQGFARLTLDGWLDKPHYDRSAHRLIWALVASDAQGKSVNYNTRVLGRRGVASLNLVTDPAQLNADKPRVAGLLAKTQFTSGARYEDFNRSTDKVAEYGLAGLVMAGAGLGAVKLLKIGLLAKFWNVILVGLLAAKKFVAISVVAVGAWLRKLYVAKKAAPPPAAE